MVIPQFYYLLCLTTLTESTDILLQAAVQTYSTANAISTVFKVKKTTKAVLSIYFDSGQPILSTYILLFQMVKLSGYFFPTQESSSSTAKRWRERAN